MNAELMAGMDQPLHQGAGTDDTCFEGVCHFFARLHLELHRTAARKPRVGQCM